MMRVILTILTFLFFFACSSPKQETKSKDKKLIISNCVSELNKDAIIRWGWVYKDEQTEKAYRLDTYGDIYREEEQKIIIRKGSVEELENDNSQFIETVSRETYCDIYIKTQKEFIKAQSLFVPADTMIFVQLINPAAGTNLRALWNPKFEAIGSKGFREVWAKLEDALPNNPIYLHKN